MDSKCHIAATEAAICVRSFIAFPFQHHATPLPSSKPLFSRGSDSLHSSGPWPVIPETRAQAANARSIYRALCSHHSSFCPPADWCCPAVYYRLNGGHVTSLLQHQNFEVLLQTSRTSLVASLVLQAQWWTPRSLLRAWQWPCRSRSQTGMGTCCTAAAPATTRAGVPACSPTSCPAWPLGEQLMVAHDRIQTGLGGPARCAA